MNFLGKAGPKLMEFIFEGALALAGAPVKAIMGILNKGKVTLGKIIKDPVGFLKNLLNAVKGGLSNFAGNIGAHLQNGIGGWIFGTLSKAGITLPEKLNLAGIFSIAAQVLGVTWRAIRTLVVKRLGAIGEKVMSQVEKGVALVTTLITKGPLALLETAKDFLAELKTLFFDTVIEWVRNTIIVKAVQKLISMFNPVGAIIQAVITIYNTIQFFIERAKQIAAFVSAVFNSIAEIAGGNIGKAVAAVENALAKGRLLIMIVIKPSDVPCKKDVLKQFEEKLGLPLEKEYLSFLEKYNGGIPESNIVELKNDEIQSFSITSFFGIGIDENNDIIKQYNLLNKRVPQGCLPIARVEGGNIVCINLINKKYGYVLLWDHESELMYEDNITIENLPIVSKSFKEFLNKIKPYDTSKQVLSGYEVQEVWIDPDFLKELEK